jgi:hypothetical protein
MSDLVTRLRDWRNVHLARLHLLMDEAADEMERLSGTGDCPAPDNAAEQDNTPAANATPRAGSEQSWCTLTDEEWAAVEWCVEMALNSATDCVAEVRTLRGLLERIR